jgi:hypothetical protein
MLEPEEVFALWWLFAKDKRSKTRNRRMWVHPMLSSRLTTGNFTLCLKISEKTMENSSTISECHPGHLTNYTASQKIIFTRGIPTCEDAFLQTKGWP